MGDTELVNGDSGSSDTSAAVRSSVESERGTGEHSPSRSTTSGTVHTLLVRSRARGTCQSRRRSRSRTIALPYIPKERLEQRIVYLVTP